MLGTALTATHLETAISISIWAVATWAEWKTFYAKPCAVLALAVPAWATPDADHDVDVIYWTRL